MTVPSVQVLRSRLESANFIHDEFVQPSQGIDKSFVNVAQLSSLI
jgi:hypothetical protein